MFVYQRGKKLKQEMEKIWEKNTGKITYNRSSRHKKNTHASTRFNHTTKETCNVGSQNRRTKVSSRRVHPKGTASLTKNKQESTIHEKKEKEREQDRSSGEISRRKNMRS